MSDNTPTPAPTAPGTPRLPPREVEPKLNYKPQDVIRLNVGGQRFDTYLRTLLADRNTDIFNHFVVLLEKDLNVSKLPPVDNEGAFFLDRDPEHFRSLLNNLRYIVQLEARRGGGTKSFESAMSLDLDDGDSKKSVGLFSRFRK